MDEIVLRCLEKSPDARCSSVLELRDMLLGVATRQSWGEADADAWWREHLPSKLSSEGMEVASAFDETLDAAMANQQDVTSKQP